VISTYRNTPKEITAALHGTTHRNTRMIPDWRVRSLRHSGTECPENGSVGGRLRRLATNEGRSVRHLGYASDCFTMLR
jgi:hypothetical protein